jgi:hypothetical protein
MCNLREAHTQIPIRMLVNVEGAYATPMPHSCGFVQTLCERLVWNRCCVRSKAQVPNVM